MEIRKAKLFYYSPTGTGKTTVTAIMNGTDLDHDIIDLTPPDSIKNMSYPPMNSQ